MEVKYWISNLSHTIHGMVCLPTFNCFLYGTWVSIYTIPMDLMGIVKNNVSTLKLCELAKVDCLSSSETS